MFTELSLIRIRVRLWWSETFSAICRIWSDCFWLMDVLLLLGGLRSPLTSNWAHEGKIRCLSSCIYGYQVAIFVLQSSDVILYEKDDLIMLAWSMIKSASIVLIFLKVLIITRSEREITNLRNFINSDRVSSGDEAYDKLQERNYKRTALTMLRIIYGIILFDSLVLSVPCDANKKILELPSLLISCGKHVKPVLYFCCSSLIPLGFLTRLLSNIAYVGTIFMGIQAKCMVLTQRYGLILKRSFSSSACDFQQMNRELRKAFIQHQEYMSHLKLLKCLVVKTLFLIHCYSVVCIGALFYITSNTGINFFSVCVVATTTTMLLEYLFWCHMVDTLQEAADSLRRAVFELCVRMPHSRTYHSQYVSVRTSLMIVSINCTGKQMAMNCYGLLEISTNAFVDLLRIVYAVMMFLKSID